MSRYRVIRVLGCNLTCTQLARDVMTDRLVILRRVSRSDPLACRQFAREADLLLKLQGRNAPCVYECLETKDERILVEEYIQGAPAAAASRRQRIEILDELRRILCRIHSLGYLYLDLKEDHLILDGNRLVLIDYDGILETGSRQCFFSTQEMMAPELATDAEKTPAADAWCWARLAARWHLYPLRRLGCLRKDPARRRDLSDFPGFSWLPLFWFVTVSVFAAGLCLPAAGEAGTENLAQAALLDKSLPMAQRTGLLEELDQGVDDQSFEKFCEEITTGQEARQVAAYALRMKMQGIDLELPPDWAQRFGEDVALLMEWKEKTDAGMHDSAGTER